MPLLDILLPEFDREIGITRSLIAVAPKADLTWRPEGHARTLGELVAHLVELPAWTGIVMMRDGYDLADTREAQQVGSLATMLDQFDKSAEEGRVALASRIDDDLTADWKLERNGHLVFALPRIAVLRVLVLNHLIHHRGQLSVYLRMRGTGVPSIYGPTANT